MNNITYKIYVNAINQRMLETESEHKDGKTKPEDFMKTMRKLNGKLLEWWDRCLENSDMKLSDTFIGSHTHAFHKFLDEAYDGYLKGDFKEYEDKLSSANATQRLLKTKIVATTDISETDKDMEYVKSLIDKMPEDFDPEIDQLDLRHHIAIELCYWK